MYIILHHFKTLDLKLLPKKMKLNFSTNSSFFWSRNFLTTLSSLIWSKNKIKKLKLFFYLNLAFWRKKRYLLEHLKRILFTNSKSRYLYVNLSLIIIFWNMNTIQSWQTNHINHHIMMQNGHQKLVKLFDTFIWYLYMINFIN